MASFENNNGVLAPISTNVKFRNMSQEEFVTREELPEDLKLIDGIEPVINYIPVSEFSNGYIDFRNGHIVSNANNQYCELTVVTGEKYRITSNHAGLVACYALLDSSGTLISAFPESEPPEMHLDSMEITIPSGAVTMRCSGSIRGDLRLYVYKVEESSNLKIVNKGDVLYGKKMVCLWG